MCVWSPVQNCQLVMSALFGGLVWGVSTLVYHTSDPSDVSAILLGVASGLLAMIVLSFVKGLLLNCLDAVFVCFAMVSVAVTHTHTHTHTYTDAHACRIPCTLADTWQYAGFRSDAARECVSVPVTVFLQERVLCVVSCRVVFCVFCVSCRVLLCLPYRIVIVR